MNQLLVQKFADLICVNTGLHIRACDTEALRSKIYRRMKVLNLSEPERYYELLEAGRNCHTNGTVLESDSEWKELSLLLTTGESYFFRDRGQIKLLETQILPELIEKQKTSRSLRIWSAGCSTGEEAYSLAIVVQKLIPNWQDWKIFILGTDINLENLEKAQRGIYSEWSFRLVDPEVQRLYFKKNKCGWKLNEDIGRMVTFRYGNLVKDEFPNPVSDLGEIDLIICRNVFVYFSKSAISLVIKKFTKTLKPGGYLLTAHAELHGQVLDNLQAKMFSESVIYQRGENSFTMSPTQSLSTEITKKNQSKSSKPIVEKSGDWSIYQPQLPDTVESFSPRSWLLPQAANPPGLKRDLKGHFLGSEIQQTTAEELLKEAEVFFQKEAYFQVIEKIKQALVLENKNFNGYYLMAQAYANLGQYWQAEDAAKQAISIDALSAEPYYLLAQLSEEQGNIEQAKIFWKRIIYLAPSSILAYLELAALYERDKDWLRAKKMRNTALDLLKDLPSEAILEEPSKIRVSELVEYVEEMLRKKE